MRFIVGFLVENWPAVDMAVLCRAMLRTRDKVADK
jgi:hypothetical protein